MIEFTAVPDDGTKEQLEIFLAREGEHFPVVRRGISDAPLQMRFGTCYWERGDDADRYLLVLVAGDEESRDTKVGGIDRIAQPGLANLMYEAVASGNALAVLVDRLEASGALSSEAADEVRQAARAPEALTRQEARRFSRVVNVKDWRS